MKERRFLLSFGSSLDHSNIDYLVKDRLSKYKGRIQEDYFNPVLHKGAEIILNYQIIDTNLNRVSTKYYLDDYHITKAQKNGFMYSLQKLKGTHVWCNPRVQGHALAVVNDIEFSLYLYHSLEGTEYRFCEYYQTDGNPDLLLRNKLHKLPADEQHLQFPSDLGEEEKDQITIRWIRKLIDL